MFVELLRNMHKKRIKMVPLEFQGSEEIDIEIVACLSALSPFSDLLLK